MGNECATGLAAEYSQPREVNIFKVANGFIVRSGYGRNGELIANTLPEALELVRKVLEKF